MLKINVKEDVGVIMNIDFKLIFDFYYIIL